ncbi:molybdate ABC transporter permease subunit [uncultured Veillonella sp.]|uniref:molybdate ABC transporter permease subunit n=1 Tax=uncultured Veillonella sp. TaxID=159268 RepID=UPI0026302F31|nr:molybdate ABC transporter permease subunit [uncultured Veillonella sp.]
MSPLWLSLEVASIALIGIVGVGLWLCYMLKRYSFPGKALIDSIVTLPLVLPPVVVGFALLVMFSPGYTLGAWLEAHGLGIVFSKGGAILAAAIIGFPLFYQTVRAALGSVDSTMEDVARTLGASELRIFFTISMPLAWKGIVTGAILAFCRALGEFGATILIAGNIPGLTRTMPLAIYSLVEFGDYEGAFELVGYICILTLGLLWFVHFITKGSLFNSAGR